MKNWEKAEKYYQKLFNATRTRGSGNGKQKGDLLVGNLFIEVKESSKDPFILNTIWFKKIILQSINRIPILAIETKDGNHFIFIQEIYYEDNNLPIYDFTNNSVSFKSTNYPELFIVKTLFGNWVCGSTFNEDFINLIKEINNE